MEKIKIAICDDEVQFAKNIKEYIVHFFENKGVVIEVDIFSSGNAFLRLEKDMLKYQIVFLDINMIGIALLLVAIFLLGCNPSKKIGEQESNVCSTTPVKEVYYVQ